MNLFNSFGSMNHLYLTSTKMISIIISITNKQVLYFYAGNKFSLS